MSTSVNAANDAGSSRYNYQLHPTDSLTTQAIFKEQPRNDSRLTSESLGSLPKGTDNVGKKSRRLPRDALDLRLEAQARQVQEMMDQQKAMEAWLNELWEAAKLPARHQIESQAELLAGIGSDHPAEVPSSINSPELASLEMAPESSADGDDPTSDLVRPGEEASDLIITTAANTSSTLPSAINNAAPSEIEPDDNESISETDPTLIQYAVCYKFVAPGTTSISPTIASMMRQEVALDAAFMPRVPPVMSGTRRSGYAASRTRNARVEKGMARLQKKKLKKCA